MYLLLIFKVSFSFILSVALISEFMDFNYVMISYPYLHVFYFLTCGLDFILMYKNFIRDCTKIV